MIRRVIQIDEEKCNGCGACANACHEGAISIVNGKAKLMRDDYCDGLGDCLPENFSPESGKIAEAVSSIVRYASSNTETELKSRVLFTEARNLVYQYVNEYSGLIKSKRLRIVERLAVIQLVQSIWAFPPLAENCDLDAFLSLCEKHRNKIF